MEEINKELDSEEYSFRDRHKFMLFIVISIFISIIIISIGMHLYNISGAAQLDLSRPGYVNIRSQAIKSDGDFKNFSSNGTLKTGDISYFKSLLEKQAQKVKLIDSFGSDPLNPDALGISDPTNNNY